MSEEEGGIGTVGIVIGGIGCLVLLLAGAGFFVFGLRQSAVRVATPAAVSAGSTSTSVTAGPDGGTLIELSQNVDGKLIELREVLAPDGSFDAAASGRYEDGVRVRDLDASERARLEGARAK